MSTRKKVHPPYDKLKGFLREKGLTYQDVATLLGISCTAVNFKINGTSDFLLTEAEVINKAYKPDRNIFL